MKVILAIKDQTSTEAVVRLATACLMDQTNEFLILNVIPPLTSYVSVAMVPDLMREMRATASSNSKKLTAEARSKLSDLCPQVKTQMITAEGVPSDEILALALRENANLIVLSSPDRNDLDRFVMGSVSRVIVSRSSCPVLMAKPIKQSDSASKMPRSATV